MEKWNIIEILDCTKFRIFDATVLNSIITWQKSSLAAKRETVGYRKTAGSNSFEELVSVPREQMNKRDLLLMNQNWGLAVSLDNLTVGIVNKITQLGITIEKVFPEISQGLIAYDKYRGQSDKIIKSRAYHSFEYRKGWKKWLWGEDVKRFVLSWNGQEYIDKQVYHLYGLSYDELLIVDPNTPITKEEYESSKKTLSRYQKQKINAM